MRDGSIGATVARAAAAAWITGTAIAGEWCAATQVAQDRAAPGSRCVCALATIGTTSNATIRSALARRTARRRMPRMIARAASKGTQTCQTGGRPSRCLHREYPCNSRRACVAIPGGGQPSGAGAAALVLVFARH